MFAREIIFLILIVAAAAQVFAGQFTILGC
jgi:hypothetical protein